MTLSVVSIAIAIVSLVVTIVLNRREKPNIMPYGQDVESGNHLSLKFLNTSPYNIHDLSILINSFDSNINEISQLNFADKFLFSIGEKASFSYGFNLETIIALGFYFRVRFKGFYYIRLPLFSRKTFEQEIWFSVLPMQSYNKKIVAKVSTTHKEEIERIKVKHSSTLKNYEKNIDIKFPV